jgi:hypothetical protein
LPPYSAAFARSVRIVFIRAICFLVLPICAVFSNSPWFNDNSGYRRYEDRSPIYIIFENGQCLIVEYPFIDSLCVDFRPLNEKENELLKKATIKDFFNCSIDIHEYSENNEGESVYKKYETKIISLEYNTLFSIELRPVTEEYEKWIDGDIDYVTPTEDTFDEIKFTMTNGNTFIICADDAYVNGYVMTWSTDAKESTIQCK